MLGSTSQEVMLALSRQEAEEQKRNPMRILEGFIFR